MVTAGAAAPRHTGHMTALRTALARLAPAVLAVGVLAACSTAAGDEASTDASTADASTAAEMFPDVLSAEVAEDGSSVAVTVSSPYDSPDRYADAIRVRSADGAEVYGERPLTHDHAAEQPFTRSVTDLEIPAGVREAVVEGRDQVSGWGGDTVTITLPG